MGAPQRVTRNVGSQQEAISELQALDREKARIAKEKKEGAELQRRRRAQEILIAQDKPGRRQTNLSEKVNKSQTLIPNLVTR